MSNLKRILLLTVACCVAVSSLSESILDDTQYDQENLLQGEYGYGNSEIHKPNASDKCYDAETQSVYKVDAVWYSKEKCEKRICSRKNDSKTPMIKTIQCEPCTTCTLPDHSCHPFMVEKNYPKCCSQCLMNSIILKKTVTKKEHKGF